MVLMDDFDLEIKREFINEALMNLEEAESSFMELEGSGEPKPLLDKIFRLAHNLKGGSRAVGFGDVAEFTHQLENLVQKIQRQEVPLSSEVVTTLLRSNDRLIDMLSALKGNLEQTFDNADLLNEIQAWLGASVPAPASSAPPVVTEVAPPPPVQSPSPVHQEPPALANSTLEIPPAGAFFESEIKAASQLAAAPKVETKANDDEVIRVNLSRIDRLNDYVGELIVLQSVLQQQFESGNTVKMRASMRQMVKLSKDVQSLTMAFRMLPVRPLIQKLQRVVRDTGKELGKSVNFEVEGEHLEIDKSVLDRLSDPLIHVLRNAVDHGLEMPDLRSASGKQAAGNVRLSFKNEGNQLVVEITDDGRGIDAEILRKKAIEKGIIAESAAMSEKQLIHLIFHPGFSTKASASEISGRGVGMDVVKTNVDKIGGHVEVSTQVGRGSVFRLHIPLSLAVIEGLVVAAESGRYVVPLSQVQETVNLKSQKLTTGMAGVANCMELRGVVVPLFTVDELLGVRASGFNREGTALIVMVEDRPMALVVNEIVRAQQIVIKPLTNGIRAQTGWVGSCVLGDGLPTLILNPADLLAGRAHYNDGLSRIEGVA